ncbi:YlbF family regulator [uncultured Eubacterium sp.]|uniref:YlbF family regulator n=1 Tax=uncultured Eubacterium sp. TaxID=165185 RepID=UPI0025CEC468|nr:YlbF family regulator [uncultured Eubacterium sp.]
MSLESALRELGKEIQADPRFEALQKAAKVNDADENLQSQMQEMQLITLKYQQEAEKGEEASQEKIAELQQEYQDLYTKVMDGENMKNYSAAAAEMEQMAQYISQMIGLFFDGQDPATCEIPASDCTHDCCTCGGCH